APWALKPAVGVGLNELGAHVETQLEERRAALAAGAGEAAAHADLSLPGITRAIGSRHILTQVFSEVERIFLEIGFSVVEGPEIKTPSDHFEAPNIPRVHPGLNATHTIY